MTNKILGIIIILVSIAALVYAFANIAWLGELAWPIIAGGAFCILVGVVVFRRGIRTATRAYHDGAPDHLK